ncbi:MAG: CHAT domain-containing protein [Bacteroidota bacterium]
MNCTAKILFFLLLISTYTATVLPGQSDSTGFFLLKEAKTLRASGEIELAKEKAKEASLLFQEGKNWLAWVDAFEEQYECAFAGGAKHIGEQGLQKLVETHEAIQLNNEFSPLADGQLLRHIAYIFHNTGEYQRALAYYEKALVPAGEAGDLKLLLQLYTNAASVCWATGNIHASLAYNEKALPLARELDNQRYEAYLLSNLADIWRMLDVAKAIPYYQQSLQLEPDNPLAHSLLSKAYLETGELEQAMEMARRSQSLAEDGESVTDALHQVGRVYFALKEYDQAMNFYQKALARGRETYGSNHPECAKIHCYLGDVLLEKNNYNAALAAYNETLKELLPLFSPTDESQNPTIEELTEYDVWTLNALYGKGKVYSKRFQQFGQTTDLEKSIAASELAILHMQNIKSRFLDDESKYLINDFYYSACDLAMKASFQLARTEVAKEKAYEAAFAISNQTKAIVLAEALYRKEIKEQANVDEALLSRERAVHGQIVLWEKRLRESEAPGYLKTCQDSLFAARTALKAIESEMDARYPAYAAAKFQFRRQPPIADIRQELPEETALIEYFLADDAIYTFVLSKDTFWAASQTRSIDFDIAIEQFIQTISDWQYVEDSSSVASKKYLDNAWFLYQQLLQAPLQLTSARRLVIVPDGILGLLPFELLLTENYIGDWADRDVPFLLKDKAVSYRFSTALLQTNTDGSYSNWGGFGSDFSDLAARSRVDAEQLVLRNGGQLPFADDEVLAIASLFGGDSWINQQATRENFLKNAENYGILHLATHGIVDRNDPLRSRLLFTSSAIEDESAVYAHEIYSMQLKAGLTVLSACNSGTGEWKKGEGIMSLARAFAFAGCPSLVMSLWNVSDQSTSELMTAFYQNLKAGQSKDEALRQAKLYYLKSTSSEYAKPIYWGSFVAVGNMETLVVAEDNMISGYWQLVLGGLFLILLLFFLQSRRRKVV